MLTVTLLGCGGTQPLPGRALSSLAVTAGGHSILIDCGEGTQVAARRWGVSVYKMDAVLLTHYHGDHIFGLPGLWQTMAAQGRTAPLLMAGPPGLEQLVRALLYVAGPLPFAIQLAGDAAKAGPLPVLGGTVQAFPLRHRTPCCGYAFTLPRAGRFEPDRARALGIPVALWRTLQQGRPAGGFQPRQVLGPPRRGLKVVYATDTRPCGALEQAAQGADLLCMDSTYPTDEFKSKAKEYGHATCPEAGRLAAGAGVRRLWLTHYSAAVTDPAQGLAAAQAFFPAAEAGFDGKRVALKFDEE